MIINPVMMRSALKARGVHAAMVSFMKAPSSPRRRLNWYRVAALRESFDVRRNLARFRRAARNNAVGQVYAAMPSTEYEAQQNKKGREIFPALRAKTAKRYPERFRAKWMPVRIKKTRQNNEIEPPFRFNRNGKGSSATRPW